MLDLREWQILDISDALPPYFEVWLYLLVFMDGSGLVGMSQLMLETSVLQSLYRGQITSSTHLRKSNICFHSSLLISGRLDASLSVRVILLSRLQVNNGQTIIFLEGGGGGGCKILAKNCLLK